jgi:excinuclease ABC subunit C
MDIKEKVKSLPKSPGVYLMRDSSGTIIYVGKAKRLKNRVQSYFRTSSANSQKVEKLKKNINDFDYILTDTEFEAFMLECKLIQKIRPFFNKKMKSTKSYAYIAICNSNKFPWIEIAYEAKENDGNQYFGPFVSRTSIEKAIQALKEIYKIDCKNMSKRNGACLNHSLGLCMGVCLGEKYELQYKSIMNKIIDLLEGKDVSLLGELFEKMESAAANLEFETASKYKEYFDTVSMILNKEKVIEFSLANQFIIVIEPIDKNIFKIFLIRGNKVLYNEKHLGDKLENIKPLLKQQLSYYCEPFFNNHRITINKNDIDESQIIYSYLNSSSCTHIIIKDETLSNGIYLDKVLDDCLNLIKKEMELYNT